MKKICKKLVIVLIILLGLLTITSNAQEITINGNDFNNFKKSKQDIYQRWLNAKIINNGWTEDTAFDEKPSYEAPYSGGVVKQEYLDLCLTNLNYYRYLSGLNDVECEMYQSEIMQAGQVLEWLYYKKYQSLTHILSNMPQPDDMDDEFYNLASHAPNHIASSSNFLSPNFSFFRESKFLTTAGHRMILLHPYLNSIGYGLGKTVLGAVDIGTASSGNKIMDKFAAYPSPGYFPYQDYVAPSDWDILLNTTYFAPLTDEIFNGLEVTIKDVKNNKTYTYNSSSTIEYTNNQTTKTIKTLGKTEDYAIHMFRPDFDNAVSLYSGDYEVTVSNLKNLNGDNVTLTYTVSFYDKYEGVSTNVSEIVYGESTPSFSCDEAEINETIVKYYSPRRAYIKTSIGGMYAADIEDYTKTSYDTMMGSDYMYVPTFTKELPSYITGTNYINKNGIKTFGYTNEGEWHFTYGNDSTLGIKKPYDLSDKFFVDNGSTVEFKATLKDYYKQDYTVYKWVKIVDGELTEITNNSNITVTNDTLKFNSVSQSDSGTYYLVAIHNMNAIYNNNPYYSSRIDVSKKFDINVTSNNLVESLKPYSPSYGVPKGLTEQLKVAFTPEDACNRTLTFTSDNPDVISVDQNGVVTALRGGKANITITSSNGVTCTIQVRCSVKLKTVTYEETEVTLTEGDTYTPIVTINPEDATDYYLNTTSTDNSVASFNHPGTIYAKSAGTCEVYSYCNYPEVTSNRIKVTVLKGAPRVTGIKFKHGEASILEEETIKYNVEVTTTDEMDYTVTWESENPAVATVDSNGNVTGVSEGRTRIIARVNGFEASCYITIEDRPHVVTGLDLNKHLETIYVGDTFKLDATVTTTGPMEYAIEWSSDNPAIANVDSNGNVTAFASGVVTISAKCGRFESVCYVTVNERPVEPDPVKVKYATHIQNIGWEYDKYGSWRYDGEMSGTSGRSLRLEGIKIELGPEIDGGVEYVTHIQNIGWEDKKYGIWRHDGEMSGTSGRSFRLEAIKIRLTGNAANLYDIYYQVHAENIGWMDWAKNGEEAGTAAFGFRLEGIRIVMVPKGEPAPGPTEEPFRANVKVTYSTHVQNIGDQAFVSNGAIAGTSGQSLRLESIRIKLENISGGIEYVTHIQNIGWEDAKGGAWKKDGERSGTSGRSFRLEAIKIRLTGEAAEKYDVYYRVHAQNVGWMGWAKNGEESGTAGHSFRLEGIQIVLVKKGQNPPAYNPPAAKTFAFYN
ncbi:MAG: Ig-like domain-containing protein [Clostridia bacterium]|nr:Ig-like domain-containing protein [Clostridia bacterium]